VLGRHRRTGRSFKAYVAAIFVAVFMALGAFSTAALAQQEGYSENQPDVDVRFGTQNQPSIDEDAGEGLLPFTGADLTLFVATGMAAIGTGVVVLRRTRPREE
jgi:ABC-type branched-subunit amino acid transport system permease subunit